VLERLKDESSTGTAKKIALDRKSARGYLFFILI